MTVRIERDALGEVAVPVNALYGAQTQRAVENFPVEAQPTIGDYPELVDGLLRCKLAAARTNLEVGALPGEVGDAILRVGEAALGEDLSASFPVHARHGGGGTSANMNANEVLANLAEESLGGRRGSYERVEPLAHVNLHQSTNDVYPTAVHLAMLHRWEPVRVALSGITVALEERRVAFAEHPRLARSCLQDAVPTTYGDLLGGYIALVSRAVEQAEQRVQALVEVPLGGTAVGDPSDVPDAYLAAVLDHLSSVCGGRSFTHPDPLADGLQNADTVVAVSAELAMLARALIKVAKDLRLLSSGPEAGFAEVRLPAMQPGSSAMPFKVNPVIPEFVIQLCFRVIANHREAELGLEHAELDVNVWEASTAIPTLESMALLETVGTTFVARCLEGLDVDATRSLAATETLIPTLTELAQRVGHQEVEALVAAARGDRERLWSLIRAQR